VLTVPTWSRTFGINSHVASFVFLVMLSYSVVNYLVVDHESFGRVVTFVTLCADLLVVIYLIGASGGLHSPLLATQLMYTMLFAMLFPSPLAIVPPLLTLPVLARIDQLISVPSPVLIDLLILFWIFTLNAVVVYVIVFLNQRDEAQARELRALQGERAQLAIAEERNRLAREIHDGLGASLSSLILQAEYSQQLTRSAEKLPELKAELAELKSAAEESIEELRRSLRMMHEDFDLVPAVEEKCRTFGERAHLPVRFEKSGIEQHLDPETQLTIFRVLQESLNNVAKHAQASQVKVGLTFRDGALVLTVTDDGVGFAEVASPGHYGLVHLRERALRLNGEAAVTSAPGKGTVITLTLPTRSAAERSEALHG
jgi:two-component system, NarL family, sensor histidine kinase DegS